MLGVLFPHDPMNMSDQPSKNLQQGGEADQEGVSHPGLAQLSTILLHPRCLISGNNLTRNGVLTKSLPTADARGSSRLCLLTALARYRHRPSPCSSASLL